jgi:uncharacterized cupredoxin-like copper-binding protein
MEEKRMLFDPPVIKVRLGEQVRFVLFNEGTEDHEFFLATKAENREHTEFMKKFPNMQHDDPNALRLPALNYGELLWKSADAASLNMLALFPDIIRLVFMARSSSNNPRVGTMA